MATNGKRPRDLLAERINRLEKQGAETNRRLDETNQRLERVEAILGSIANILAGQGRELERHSQLLERHSQILEQHTKLLQTLTERLDRFADAVIIGRTRDTERVGELERRVETLERQVFGGTPPSRS
jgi:chromosome segregation ATPase